MQFENIVGNTLQDGKLVRGKRSFYHVADMPPFAAEDVLTTARQQVAVAQHAGLRVEWLVSEQKAVTQLNNLFKSNKVPITVTFLPE
jgi:hypothetical protein